MVPLRNSCSVKQAWGLGPYIPVDGSIALSLYSTAKLLAKICVGDTNMLVSKNTKICLIPNAKHKICVSPNVNPQCKLVEYRLRWVPNAKFLRGHVHLIFVHVDFICVGPLFVSRIWALGYTKITSKS